MGRACAAIGALALLLLTAPCTSAEAARRSWRSESARTTSQHEPARENVQPETAGVSEQSQCMCPEPPPLGLLSSPDVLLVSHCLVLAFGIWLGKSRGRTQQTPVARAAAASTAINQQPVAAEYDAPVPAHSHCNGSMSPHRSASPQCSVVNACLGSSPNSVSAAMHKAGAPGMDTPEQPLQHEQLHDSQCVHQHEHTECCSQQAVGKHGEQPQAPHQLQTHHEEGEHGGQAGAQQECSCEQHKRQEEEQREDEQPAQVNVHPQSRCGPPDPSPPPSQLVSSPGAPWPVHGTKGTETLSANSGNSLTAIQHTSTQSSQHALATLASQLNLLLSERMATDKLQIVLRHELDPRSFEQARQFAGELQAIADRGVAAQSLKLGAQHLGTMSQSLQQCVQFAGGACAFVHKWYAGQMMKQQKELCTRCLQGGFCIMLLVLMCSAFAHGRLSRLADLTTTCSSKGESSAWFSPSRWASVLLASGRITGMLGWVLCAANELGLFGLGITGFVVAALKVPRLLSDVHHSWQFYLPVCMGCAGGYAGTNLVSALGGAWLVWLVLWEAWVVMCCGMYAWEVSSWKVRSLLVFALSIALPCPMGFMPFHWTAEVAERFLLQGLLLY